jgi:HAD superfamily hydrolase (TIGR01509 family)
MYAKCILFDCDGTLVDSENITNSVVAKMAAELGINMNLREAQEMFGGKTLDAVIYGMKELSGKDIPNDWLPRLVEEVSKAYEADLRPMEGIKELLDNINIPICVASNGEPRHVKSSLTLTGLIDYFNDDVFTASEVERPKPAPDLFLYAAKQMGFKPKDCIVIEDSIPGVTAAVNANIKVYGLVKLCSTDELENAGAIPFKTMHELSDLLGI